MSDVVVKVENLSKHYILRHETQRGYSTIREEITKTAKRGVKNILSVLKNTKIEKPKKEEFWALNNLSFEIHHGDRVGIIGRNGSGKSTLLKILSRVVEPTRGRVSLKGRVASLLEVGTGFHPELTGRENIFLNGAVLGMAKDEVRRKFDEIVDFSGVEKFLDTPVKRYSSGMYVRLAFAVAAHLEPEILVVDEVLAVGDAEFQKKCIGKMEDVSKSQGRTVLFVSHNMAAVQSLCNRGIVLQAGEAVCDDTIQVAVSQYLGSTQKQQTRDLASVTRLARHCSGEARITAFTMRNEGAESEIIDADKPSVAEITFEVFQDNTSVGPEFTISDDFQKLSLFHSFMRNGLVPVFNKGIHKMICHIGAMPLVSGSYYISMALTRPGVPIDYLENAHMIDVQFGHRDGMRVEYKKESGNGCVYIDHNWEVGY